MEQLTKIVSESKYVGSKGSARIITNIGDYYKNDKITDEDYKNIKMMKVFGNIMENHKFESFINLEVLDVSSMDFIKLEDPFFKIKEILKVEIEPVKPTELLEIYTLKKLKTLKISLKTKNDYFQTKKIEGDFSFLDNLPHGLETLIICNFSKNAKINFTNLPSTVNQIKFIKLPLARSKDLIDTLIEKLKKCKFPFDCEIYFDDVKLNSFL